MQIVWNYNEEWAEFFVKKNRQIVWNDNKEWAVLLCKCNRCMLVFTGGQSPYLLASVLQWIQVWKFWTVMSSDAG